MSRPAPAPALLVFAKDPVPGTVKTRLAAAIGPERATRVYTDLLATTLGHGYAAVRAKVVSRIELWCAPDCDGPFLRSIAAAFVCSRHRQGDGDLGIRMAQAIADALTRAPAVLLIGTDCPLLDPVRLGEAAVLLSTQDAVLGPAEDGGYVLVGARRPLSFDGVRWSTAHAFADTAAAFARAGIRFATLPVSWDVDEPADLARWNALRNAPASERDGPPSEQGGRGRRSRQGPKGASPRERKQPTRCSLHDSDGARRLLTEREPAPKRAARRVVP